MIDIIIIGDNNKTTADCVKSIKETTKDFNIILQRFSGNYNESINQALKVCNSEYIVICNNDLIFRKGWKEVATRYLQLYDTVSPWCDKTHNVLHKNERRNFEGFKKSYQFTGWCIITKRETIDKIGGKLDTSALFYRSDAMFAKQLIEAKCKNILVHDCKVTHLGHVTANELKGTNRQLYKQLTIEQIYKIGKVKGFD